MGAGDAREEGGVTIKEQRRQRKQRPRVLHDGNGFRPARDLIRRRLVSTSITYCTTFGGEREIARRKRQIHDWRLMPESRGLESRAEAAERVAAGW